MYIEVITAVIILYKLSFTEAGVTGRYKRDTGRTHVGNVYSLYKQESFGEATYYGKYPEGVGACSLDPLSPLADQPGWIRVAAAAKYFQNSLGCGMCVEITGTGVGKGNDPISEPLKGVVHDLCGCNGAGVDLFIEGDGKWEVEIKAIDCPKVPGSDGNIMLRFTGSNPWYIKLQARNTRIPVAGIEVLKENRYYCLRRASDNYFVGDGLGKVDFPMQVRLTAVNGEQRETIIPAMKNDEDTTSDIQFTGHATGSGPSSIVCMGQGNKPPYPKSGLEPGSTGISPGGRPGTGVPPAPAPRPKPRPEQPRPPTPGAEENDFCKNRPGGVYVDPVYCRALIICNNQKVNRQFCPKGQLFNPKGMNCDLASRVDCGSRSLDDPPQEKDKERYTDMAVNDGRLTMGRIPISAHYEENQGGLPMSYQGLTPHVYLESNVTGKADQPLIYMTKEQRQLNKSEERPHLDFDSFAEDTKKDGKSKPEESSKKISTLSSRPLVHVTIDSDQGSDRASDKASDKIKPSLEISVNKDGIKARLGGGHGGDDKEMDHQEYIGNSGTLHFQVDNKGIHARVGNSKGPLQQQDKKETKGDEGIVHMQVNGNGIHARLGSNREEQEMDNHGPKSSDEIIHMQVSKDGFHARLGGSGGRQVMDSQESRGQNGVLHMQVNNDGIHARLGSNAGQTDQKDSQGKQDDSGELHVHLNNDGIHIGSSSNNGQQKDGNRKEDDSGELHLQVNSDGIHARLGGDSGRTDQKDNQGKQEGSSRNSGQQKNNQGKQENSEELHMHVNNEGIHAQIGGNAGQTDQKDSQGNQEGSSSNSEQQKDSKGKEDDSGALHVHVNNDGIHIGGSNSEQQKDSNGKEDDSGVLHVHVNNDGIHIGGSNSEQQKDSKGKEDDSGVVHMHVNNDGIHIGSDSSSGQQQDSKGKEDDSGVLHMHVNNDGTHIGSDSSSGQQQDSKGKEDDSGVLHMHVDNDGIHIGGSSSGRQKEQDSQGKQENGEVFHMQVNSNGFNARLSGNGAGKQLDDGNPRGNGKLVQVQGKIGVAKNKNVKANFELTIRKDSDREISDSSRHASPDPNHEEERKATQKEAYDESQTIQNTDNLESAVSVQPLLKPPVPMNEQPSFDKNDATKDERPISAEAVHHYQTNGLLKGQNHLTEEHAKSNTDINPEDILALPQSDQPTISINNDNPNAKNSDTAAPTTKVDSGNEQQDQRPSAPNMLQHEKDINEAPKVIFHHPLDALTAYQNHFQMKNEEAKASEQGIRIIGHEETSGKEYAEERPSIHDNQAIPKEDGNTNGQGFNLPSKEQTNGKGYSEERPSVHDNQATPKEGGNINDQGINLPSQEQANGKGYAEERPSVHDNQATPKEGGNINDQGINLPSQEQANGKGYAEERPSVHDNQATPKEGGNINDQGINLPSQEQTNGKGYAEERPSVHDNQATPKEGGNINDQGINLPSQEQTNGKEYAEERPSAVHDNQATPKEAGNINDQGIQSTGQGQTNGKANAEERPSGQDNQAILQGHIYEQRFQTLEQKETGGQEKVNEKPLGQVNQADNSNEQGVKATEEQASGKIKPEETQIGNNDQANTNSQVIKLIGNENSFGNEKVQEVADHHQNNQKEDTNKNQEQDVKVTGEELIGTAKPSDNKNPADQQDDVKVVSEESIRDKNEKTENTNPTTLKANAEANESGKVQGRQENEKMSDDTTPTVDIFMDDVSDDATTLRARARSHTDDAVVRSNSARPPVETTIKKKISTNHKNLSSKKHEVKGHKHRHHHHHHHH